MGLLSLNSDFLPSKFPFKGKKFLFTGLTLCNDIQCNNNLLDLIIHYISKAKASTIIKSASLQNETKTEDVK